MSNLHGWYYLIQLVTLPMKEHHSKLHLTWLTWLVIHIIVVLGQYVSFVQFFLKVCYLRSFSLVIVYINLFNGFHHSGLVSCPSGACPKNRQI